MTNSIRPLSLSLLITFSIATIACTYTNYSNTYNSKEQVENITLTSMKTQNNSANTKYLQARENFSTHLIHQGKSPQGYSELKSTNHMKVVEYPSDGRMLKGLLETSNIVDNEKKPVLIFLHGGFALGESDIYDTKPFLDKGFVVFAPSYRGENGNDGNYELMLGEVDDAKSAVEWIAKQSFTDTNNIYVFGHSIGGAMALQLAFFSDLPIKHSGSSAGLYHPNSLFELNAPFIPDSGNSNNVDPQEFTFRIPLLNLDAMARKHIMYIGSKDYYDEEAEMVKVFYPRKKTLLTLEEVEGDHFSSLVIAMNAFIEKIGY